jgi:hypothetical protein
MKEIDTTLIPTTLAMYVGETELAVSGKKLSVNDRRELVERSRAGEQIELSLTARVSSDPVEAIPLPKSAKKKANANFSRFDPEQIESFASSFKGRPFLRDHDRRDLRARGGTIKSSELRRTEKSLEFVQVLELVEPWAVQLALTGSLQTFSIGWDPKKSGWAGFKESAICSVCGESQLGFDCPHLPGQEVKLDESGESVIVETLWRNVKGAETSAVSFPAVAKTGIEDFQTALSALKESRPEKRPVDEILKVLGVENEEGALSAIAGLQEAANKLAETDTLLAAEREVHETTKVELAELKEARAAELAEQRKVREEALIERAISEGRIRPMHNADGEREETEVEKAIRMQFAVSENAAIEYVDGIPEKDPVGKELESRVEVLKLKDHGLTPQQKSIARQLNVSHESWREANPQDGE